MAQRSRRIFSRLALLAGLSLWTLAPYGGCSCSNPLDSSAPASTYRVYGGAEAGKVPLTLVDDFNDGAASTSQTGHWQNVYISGVLKQVWYNGNNPAYRVNLWGGGTYTQADAFGSQYGSSLNPPGSANPAFSNPGACLEFGCSTCGYGRNSPPIACAPTNDCGADYPFVQHGLFLSPEGAAGDANVEFNNGVPTTGLSTAVMAANHGLQFDVYVVSNTLQVKLKLLYLDNYTNSVPCTYTDTYQYHEASVSGLTAGWNYNVQIPFGSFKLPLATGKTNSVPGTTTIPATEGVALVYGTGADKGTLANSAAWVDGNGSPIGTLRISAIEFDPATAGGGACSTTALNNFETQVEPYEFLIDNVEFY